MAKVVHITLNGDAAGREHRAQIILDKLHMFDQEHSPTESSILIKLYGLDESTIRTLPNRLKVIEASNPKDAITVYDK